LAGCLDAVEARWPGTPVALDYASFDGRPALVVWLRTATGIMVVAVGPNCGLTGVDALASF
jgi:hypothetical protein